MSGDGNVCQSSGASGGSVELADLIDNGTLDPSLTIVDTPPQLPRAGFSPPLSARKGQWREHGCWPRRAGVYKQTWAQGVYKLTPLYEGEAPGGGGSSMGDGF